MSIATQIERLQTIKTQIQNALVNKGVIGASTHNMENFADDIESITTGIDISDTTATAEHVETGYQFYGSDGVKKDGSLEITEFTLATGGAKSLVANKNYRSTKSVVAIPGFQFLMPTEEGTEFTDGYYKMSDPGYAYSEKPSGGRIVSSTLNLTNKAWGKATLGFRPRMFIFKANGVQPMHVFDVVNHRFYTYQGGTQTDATNDWLITNSYIVALDDGVRVYAQNSFYTSLNYIAIE